MEIDRKTLKALAADTRLDILKSLGRRRKMPSELSKEMRLAPSTILEHLSKLETASLVKKENTGHKWVYYSLTGKGENLVKPKAPVQFILMLTIGTIFVFSGIVKYFSRPVMLEMRTLGDAAAPMAVEETASNVAKQVGAGAVYQAPIDWLMIALLVIGIALIAIGIVLRIKRK
ncbi:MAG: winged helix-turn-helix transcriptional regulator [Candidatus Aenigmarchaeota archaeon]|nr:winged helix-turn-helix transcriptional regulator [Candidatus Aenigmarchaeota archaeon]